MDADPPAQGVNIAGRMTVLARHSHEVFKTMLAIMDRQDLLIALEFDEIEQRIERLTVLTERLKFKDE